MPGIKAYAPPHVFSAAVLDTIAIFYYSTYITGIKYKFHGHIPTNMILQYSC